MGGPETRFTAQDERPHRKGWAPGKYIGATCRECGLKMTNCEKRAYMCADCAYADWTPTHRHGKTGGLYRLTDQRVVIEATMQRAVVYEGQDGTFWVRPSALSGRSHHRSVPFRGNQYRKGLPPAPFHKGHGAAARLSPTGARHKCVNRIEREPRSTAASRPWTDCSVILTLQPIEPLQHTPLPQDIQSKLL